MRISSIYEALAQGAGKNLLQNQFRDEASPERWSAIRSQPFFGQSLRRLHASADRMRGTAAGSLPFSAYCLYDTTGNRIVYEQLYFEHRLRLNTAAILMLMGEPEAPAMLEDAIWAICDEYTWCLPAHLANRSLETDDTGRVHETSIDLFASETAFALSEIVALLEDRLHPVVVTRARQQVMARVLEPMMSLSPMWRWEGMTNNWSAVCAGSIGIAALCLIQDPAVLAPVIQRVMQILEVFLDGYENDGACPEGLGYWNYGFGFYTAFADRLYTATGGAVDLMAGKKIAEIALFQQRAWLTGNAVVSFSDGSVRGKWHPGLTSYLRKRFPAMRTPPADVAEIFGDDHCHRWNSDYRNFLWVAGDETEESPEASTDWLEDAAWLISRSVSKGVVCAFAAKAGHNDEPHNHNDLGSFIVNAGGENLLTDLGCGEYTKSYFGPERYTILCNHSGGHSVPLAGGIGQSAGRACAAVAPAPVISDVQASWEMELAGAYPGASLRSLIRAFVWEKQSDPVLKLKDTAVFTTEAGQLVSRLVTQLPPEVQGNRILLRGRMADAVICPVTENAGTPVITKEVFVNHSGVPEAVWLMDYTTSGLEACMELEIRLDIHR